MPKKLCIIHANCQGDTLKFLLESTPSFNQEYSIIKYTNYLDENIEQGALQRCHLLLYQRIGDKWGDNASEALLAQLSPHAYALEIPNMFFNGYWPLWTNKTFMAYGDLLLEELCTRPLQPAEILHLYIRGKLGAKYSVDDLRQQSYEKELGKEAHAPIKTLEFIEAHWRQEQLFHTVNHPAPIVSLYVADQILQHLSFDVVADSARQMLFAHEEEFIQPIHPQVGALYHLPFASAERLYPVYGQSMTFESYAAAYIQCRLQKGADAIKDFVVYLHLLAQGAHKTCPT